jgi:glycogen debranching enzyme
VERLPALNVLDGSAFVLSERHGDVDAQRGLEGFFWEDTRVISRFRLLVDGREPELLSTADVDSFAAQAFLVPPSDSIYDNPQLSIMRRRLVRGTWLEELLLVNHRHDARVVRLRIDVDADFADLFEVKDDEVRRRHVERRAEGRELRLAYRRDGFARSVTVACEAECEVDGHGFELTVTLEPHETCPVRLTITPSGEQAGRSAAPRAVAGTFDDARAALHDDLEAWVGRAPALETDWDALRHTYSRSVHDLAALRFSPWPDRPEAVPAAGMPWFMALFGRDSLLTSYQAMPFLPELGAATLRVLAEHQARERDDARDAEPGKILHELRFGELTVTGQVPFGPYYGTADATPLFVILLEEAHRWSGDDGLARELEPQARAALAWLGDHGDLLGDGYVRYARRAPNGLLNQCWKDSYNSMLFRDGSVAKGPIACCEIQGYAYDARRRGARLAREVWDDPALADRLEAEAAALRARFHEDFWLPEREAYALALDGDSRPVDSLTSNMGHLLWSGIADPEPAAALARHLLGDELFSGWGVRTMGRLEGGYNPVEYHDGTVWPHDSSIIAQGLAGYGFRSEATAIAHALVDAAERFHHRLPETFAGYPRAQTGWPVEYPTASSPQAWAAGAPLLLLRAMLALEPGDDGPSCDPCLPGDCAGLALRGVPGRWGRADVEAYGAAGERLL